MCTNGMSSCLAHAGRRDCPSPHPQPLVYSMYACPRPSLRSEDGAKGLAQRRLGGGRIHQRATIARQARLRHDVLARALRESQEDHRRSPDVREDRRVVRRDPHVVVRALDSVEDDKRAASPAPTSAAVNFHHGQGAARRVFTRCTFAGARHDGPHAAPGDVASARRWHRRLRDEFTRHRRPRVLKEDRRTRATGPPRLPGKRAAAWGSSELSSSPTRSCSSGGPGSFFANRR